MAKPPKVPDGSKSTYDPTRRTATEIRMRQEEAAMRMEKKMANLPKGPHIVMMDALGASLTSKDLRDMFEALSGDGFSESLLYGTRAGRLHTTSNEPTFKHRGAVKEFIHTAAKAEDWQAMIGNEKPVEEMRTAIEAAFTSPELFEFYNMKAPKGILLWGPPGNGKTMLARIAASVLGTIYNREEAEVLIVNGPSIQQAYVGETEKKIRQLYSYAKEYKLAYGHPLVIFFDEADSLFPNRDRGYRYEASQVATLLAEMDGVDESGALTILATNRPAAIDEAILRPGRIDVKIRVGRPSLAHITEHLIRAHKRNPMRCSEESMSSVADYLVKPTHVVSEFIAGKSDGSEVMTVPVTLAHIVSGAMCAGIFDKAKVIAFNRDLKTGKGEGIFLDNLFAAVDELVLENKGLHHESAMHEIMEDLNLQQKAANLKRMN